MKKFITILVALMVLVSSLAGCGSSSETPGTNETPAPAPQQSTQPEGTAEDATNMGTAENPVVLTMVAKDMPKNDPVTIKYFETIEKAMAEKGMHIKLDLVEIQEGTYADSVSLLLQSGTIPDIIYFQGGDYQFGVTQGILEDLTPYVEKSEYVKGALEAHSVQCLQNYPYLLWIAPTRTKVPVVRKDWFEGMETSAALVADPTPENYYQFFKEIQQKYTKKSAFTVQGATDGLLEVDMILGQAFSSGMSWVKDASGKYTYSKISDAELAKLEYYAKLYKEKLLDNEYLSKKYDAKEKAMYTGEVGVIAATQGTVVSNYNNKSKAQNGDAGELMVLPPAKGQDSWSFTPIDVSKESRGWAIGANSKNKELAFKFFDFMASPEGQTIDKLGFEGEHYNIVNNKIVLTENIKSWYPRVHESVAVFEPVIPFDESTPYMTQITKDSYEMVAKHSLNDNAFLIPDELVTEWDAATAVYKEFAADMVSGKKTAADWNEFVEKWKSMGGQAVIDYANTILK